MSDADALWVASLTGSYFVDQLEMEMAAQKPEYLPGDQEFMGGYFEGLRLARYLWRCATEGRGAALLEEVGTWGAVKPEEREP